MANLLIAFPKYGTAGGQVVPIVAVDLGGGNYALGVSGTDGSIPSGAAGGDLSGTYPDPTVAKINGVTITGTPSTGQVLTATGTTAAHWATGGGGGGTFPATTALIKGTGVANVGADSMIDPADVVSGNLGALVFGNLIKWESAGASDSGIVAATATQGITNGAAVGAATGIILSDGANNITGTSDLPDGITATTQAAADGSTKVATTAYADTAAAARASAAQGAKADSALQPDGDGSGLTSLTASNITAGALADGMTATTQAENDNSTKVSTTAYTDTAVGRALLPDGDISDTSGTNSEIRAYIKRGSFSGVGTATTTFTVTIGATMEDTNYKAVASPSNILSAAIFYINNKTTTTFDVVYLAGLTGTVAFDWILAP